MTSVPHPIGAVALAFAGLVSLAAAMGIGRFAFTPLLPMMLAEGSIGISQASVLASANYLGYLLGALACTFQPWIARRLGGTGHVDPPRMVRAGLVATGLLTLGMAVHVPAAWGLLRFAAGLASAVVFIYTTSWCMEQLARRDQPSMGALLFVGPGAGILVSGLAASGLVAVQAPAALGWATFGVLCAALTAVAWPSFHPRHAVAATPAGAVPSQVVPAAAGGTRAELAIHTFAYGLAGIGYIVTATFLPVIARQALPGSPWLDLFWPLLGLGVMVGAMLASRLSSSGDLRLRLAFCYAMQAAGVAASLVAPTLAGFAIGSLLVGLPFTTITFFALQEARRLRPLHATSFMGLITAMYGLGQIAGPPLAAWLVARSATPAAGFTLSLWITSGLLLLGALLYLLLARLYPVARREAPGVPGEPVSGSPSGRPAARG